MQIYLDNAATSFPRPSAVKEAIGDYLDHYGVSPGRSGYSLSLRAAREVFEAREMLADFFNLKLSERVVFTANATTALNIAIQGILKQGDHVIISPLEHNSVLRPLRHLEQSGTIGLSVAGCDPAGNLNLQSLNSLFRPNTRMVVINHGSNVAGTVQPVREVGALCRKHGAIFLVDAAQTAGLFPIDMQQDHIDLLAFTGHKNFYGPPGIGGLCIQSDVAIKPLVQGGTGSLSESEIHPGFYPDRLEAGTPNTLGIIGLKAGLQYILKLGIDSIRERQLALTQHLLRGLRETERVNLIGPEGATMRLPVISITVKGMPPSELAEKLDRNYGIMTRPGLQCSPLAHQNLGSFPQGTVRFSIGSFNTMDDIRLTLEAVQSILKEI